MYYDRSNGGTDMNLVNIRLNLTTQKPIDISVVIIDTLNTMLESRNKIPRLATMNYDGSIYINWYNAGDSSDIFEFRICFNDINKRCEGH
jgi:hypothetical protein